MHTVTVTVPVLKDFTYNNRQIKAGAYVEMTPVEAALQARAGNVSLSRVSKRKDMTAEEPQQPAEAPRRRRRNSRRTENLEDETAAEAETAAADAQPRSNRYQRRDMTAEDPK